ncbi:MAG: aldehyde ferredoxin oxidoreductase family protein [Thermoplasmata archaeon]
MAYSLEIDQYSYRKTEIDKSTLKKYIGGTGLGIKILNDAKTWEYDGLSPGNILAILPGLLTGSGFPTASKTIFMARSPLTGGVGRAVAGAYLGVALKSLDILALSVKGAYDKWTGIVIDDDINMVNASDFYGLDTKQTIKKLYEKYSGYATAVIGPAGENLSLISSIECDGRQAARTGLGAVMGSKKIKFIVAKSGKLQKPSNSDGFKEEIKNAVELLKKDPRSISDMKYGTASSLDLVNRFLGVYPAKNFQQGYFEEVYNNIKDNEIPEIDPAYWTKKYDWKYHPCPGCTKPCGKYVHVESKKYGTFDVEGLEYETIYSLGSNLNIKNFEDIAYLHYLSDLLGIDAISAGLTISWAMEAFDKKLIPKDILNDLKINFGDTGIAVKLLKKMAYREGSMGALLADGVKRASEKIKAGGDFAMHSKSLEPPAYDVRGLYGMALAAATSVRGWDHLDSLVYAPEFNGKFWIFENVDRKSYENKGSLVKTMQDFSTFFDLTGICKLSRGSLIPEKVVNAISYYLGVQISLKDLMDSSERAYNLQKIFNLKCNLTRNDDTLPERIFKDSIPNGPSAGMSVDKKKFEKLVDEYYQARGWSVEGIPTKAKLQELEIDDYFNFP